MKYSAVNTTTSMPVQIPAGQPVPPEVKYMFLPRIRCHDCPGKLYTPGPDMTAQNFEVHLKNKGHRVKVETRIGKTSRVPAPGAGQSAAGSGAGAASSSVGVGKNGGGASSS
jgi:SWI/SNF-related matrix-associated actin-dependent regulator of chromatin subfamily B member 1